MAGHFSSHLAQGCATKLDQPIVSMIALESLQYSTFAPLVGSAFMVKTGAGAELRLHEVKQLGGQREGASRPPFSLTFRGPHGLRIQQGIHRIASESLGEMEIFITQLAPGAQGSEFEAVFT
jgi:hypothetical protein